MSNVVRLGRLRELLKSVALNIDSGFDSTGIFASWYGTTSLVSRMTRAVLILVTRLTSDDLDTVGFQTFLSYALLKCVIGLEFDPLKLGHASARGLNPDTSTRFFSVGKVTRLGHFDSRS